MRSFLPAGGGQGGSALIITLLVMASLTIIGIVSLDASVLEIQIGNNENQIREAFYLAESAVMEGIQRLSAMSEKDLNEQLVFWHHPFDPPGGAGRLDFRDPGIWDADGAGEDNALVCGLSSETYVAAVEWAVATGASLIQTDARLYQNRIYGLCRLHGSDQLIEVGYYMRY